MVLSRAVCLFYVIDKDVFTERQDASPSEVSFNHILSSFTSYLAPPFLPLSLLCNIIKVTKLLCYKTTIHIYLPYGVSLYSLSFAVNSLRKYWKCIGTIYKSIFYTWNSILQRSNLYLQVMRKSISERWNIFII